VADRPGKSLAERLDFLFKTVRQPGTNREFTFAQVQDRCREMGYKLSDSSIQSLRNGSSVNPTISTLEALARFFGVPATYFLNQDEDETAAVVRDLQLLAAMQDEGIRSIAMRAAGLVPNNREVILQVIESMHAVQEGKQDTKQEGTSDPAAQQNG